MENKYTEIFKLKEMLEKENIEFGFSNLSVGSKILYQIGYNKINKYIIVLQGRYTYGGLQDLLQVKIADTKKNTEYDEYFLTAKEVYGIIKNNSMEK